MPMPRSLVVNGREHSVEAPPDTPLLWVLREACEAYRTGRADFADYLIGAVNRHAGCSETVTFDRRLKGASGFRLL